MDRVDQLGLPYRSPFFSMDGGNHLKWEIIVADNTNKDVFTELNLEDDITVIKHLKVKVHGNEQARVKINDCVSTLAAGTGILVDYEHPLDLKMPIDTAEITREASTSLDCEVLAWY